MLAKVVSPRLFVDPGTSIGADNAQAANSNIKPFPVMVGVGLDKNSRDGASQEDSSTTSVPRAGGWLVKQHGRSAIACWCC